MAIEQIRAQIIASIWQAVAQSGVDLTTIPQGQQEMLVSRVADSVMVTMNSMLEEAPPQPPEKEEVVSELGEDILWHGRPFLSLNETYLITSERIKIVKGLLARNVENFELIRIQDIDVTQAVGERMVGIGDITIRGQDASQNIVVLRNISSPEKVYEILRKAWLEARKRHGLQFREYM